jgi:hypothetical protein
VAYPTSTVPLRQAVLRALTHHTGQPRCLTPDRLFAEGIPADFLNDPRQHPTAQKPRCFVPPITGASDQRTLTMTNRRHVAATVSVVLWYGGAHPLSRDEWSRVVSRAEEDVQLVSAALCYPGALAYAPDGTETGVDGGSLVEAGGHEVRGPEPLAGELGLITVIHTFRCGVELTQPSD